MRRKLHFSILLSLSENSLAKHSNCSFKVLKSLKKNRTFKKSVFNSKFSFGHVECSFKKQVEIFPPRFKKSFSSSYVSCNTNISKIIHIDMRIAFLTNRVKLCCLKSKTTMFQFRKKWNLLNFQKFIFNLKMILWRHRVQFSILIPLPKSFSPSTVIVRSKFRRIWKKRELSEVWFFIDLLRRRLQFSILITLPKSFSPSTGNMRSKFWRNWKKRKLSKVLIFDWSCDTKTAIFNFDIPAENFFAEHGKCSFEVLKILKKKENFQKFDFLIDLMRRKLHFSILLSLSENFLAKHSNCSFKVLKSLKKKQNF